MSAPPTAAWAVLAMAFFGGEAFIPLALTDVRGLSTGPAGLAVTSGALGWSAGSWVQERLDGRTPRPAMTSSGLVLLAVGVLGVSMTLSAAVPAAFAAAAWALTGAGMGVAYASVSLLVLAAAPAGREGATTAAPSRGHLGATGTAVPARSPSTVAV